MRLTTRVMGRPEASSSWPASATRLAVAGWASVISTTWSQQAMAARAAGSWSPVPFLTIKSAGFGLSSWGYGVANWAVNGPNG